MIYIIKIEMVLDLISQVKKMDLGQKIFSKLKIKSFVVHNNVYDSFTSQHV